VPEILIAEIPDGELVTSRRPSFRHVRATSAIRGTLDPFDRWSGGPGEPGDWWILFEPELHLGVDILVPDLAGWRREHMPVLEDVAYSELAPDWVCEVLSPSTARIDRVRKMPIYARERVSDLWLIHPGLQTLEVYRLGGQHWVVASSHVGAESVHATPFEAIELDTSRWWLEES
jgi:Uma2 family endonuclease